MKEKHHDQYGKWDDLRKIKVDEQETYIEGVKKNARSRKVL